MINKINPHKPAEQPVQNADAKQKMPAQALKSPAPSLSAIPRSAASLAAAAGLPADRLSSFVISFARFFSLPLKPQLLADIRRQALVPSNQTAQANQENPSSGVKAHNTLREALSFAAAAAESKGVELQPKGLESYAEAVDPDSQRQEQKQRKRSKEKDKKINASENEGSKKDFITADLLKKMALEYTEENPLLDILNKLPLKNAQRWIVFPFDFDGFRVSMRILLDEEHACNRAVCMVLDILKTGGAEPKKRQLFILESANEKPVRLIVYNRPMLEEKAHPQYKSELSELLGIQSERIFIRSSDDSFAHEACCDEPYTLIDEAV
ncbi:MAG: hypothetical protein FWD40_07165 [Treponema sp.]|nr:hypothetical protein [Treponema sp.]